jgi:plasmid stabilization system protein ParE
LAEYEAAAVWYADRSTVAALSFIDSIDVGIESVCEMPHAWPNWPGRGDVRRRVLRGLPYSII